jgi:hypothetical protein
VRWKRKGLVGHRRIAHDRRHPPLVLDEQDRHLRQRREHGDDRRRSGAAEGRDRLVADALEPGGFIAWSRDGRIERLSAADAGIAAAAAGEPAAAAGEPRSRRPERLSDSSRNPPCMELSASDVR